ncbi:GMC family oxidoreductase [Roseibacterium sp. SDUM158016]|uniref:FAD-dependent oxidoreductase n=1 Tax=Roseicyclus sediminis TaxID=2980997 RepID=UPI0021CF142C|nr:GMC family oxidoreductase [Roseibacterium sp. SDUM158016]MCU4651395.1 GMC family oxidoreductase [Roseibacterium sp. SDUM158016]
MDVLIVGSGMGGATTAAALAPSGRRILILERGERLEDTSEARDPEAIFARGHFRPMETWLTPEGARFNPGNYACVGGNTKFYGAVLMRYRAEDFAARRHMGGTAPGWPISYDEIEPWYQQAETLYRVRGAIGEDPTEPPHSGPYPFPPVPDEPEIADLRRRLKRAGLHPASLPLGVDIEQWLARAATPWDAFPDTTGAKMDAESVGLAEALKHPNVELRTGVTVDRLEADASGRITAALTSAGRIAARQVVLAAGAVHSAAILLRSATDSHPSGLANRSDQVGRNFMNHNCSALLALSARRNRSVYQKTLYLNDWYSGGGPNGEPLGNVQLLGRVSGPILAAQTGLPRWLAQVISDRAIDFYVMSEDLPDPDSRVTLRDGEIVLNWTRSNWSAHETLLVELKAGLRRAGFPVILSKAFDRRTPSHQCGTARMGKDPGNSVVTPWGRSHDHANLWIADASVLPTSAAVNPSLTIAAHALRVAHEVAERTAEAAA